MSRILCLLVLLSVALADKWAVIVSGSAYYYNYRHQADAAHAYHVLLNNGYSPEHIITFSINDVPNASENPFPGTLYNKPGNGSINYNEGFVVDYSGAWSTPDLYLEVIKGIKKGNNKVLETTEEDTILLIFFDHGSKGLISFTNGSLYSDQLLNAFTYMHENKKYKRIVYYMEACHSGSMFESLPTDWNIYALTSANPDEPSYACYCTSQAFVNGVDIGSCLGDYFSVSWMENVDAGDLTQTFKQHSEKIAERVVGSNVMRYGDLSFEDLPISEAFEGDLVHVNLHRELPAIETEKHDIYYNKLNYYKHLYETRNSQEYKQEYEKELELISTVDTYFEGYFKMMINKKYIQSTSLPIHQTNFECYRQSVDIIAKKFENSDYLFKYYNNMFDICAQYDQAYLYL
ncbi:hypothetical protein WA158_000145 [Blastocystis sp. Blastoise]